MLETGVPGLEQNDLDIRVENNTLVLRGERKSSSQVNQDNYHRAERSYGAFARSFSLPTTVDPEKITASYQNGVLQITMAKREETKPKQIKVQVQGSVKAAPERKQVA